jgi:TRAP transporter TAXI family solute receptor
MNIEINRTRPLRLLSLDKEKLRQISAKHRGWIGTIVPKGSYSFVKEDTPALMGATVASCRPNVPDEVAYNIVKAVCENVDNITAAYPAMKGQITLESMASVAEIIPEVLPLHPGAERYYKEKGVLK